jgi:uncharacterized OB-fold protein
LSDQPAGPDRQHQAYLEEGRFMIQRDRASGAHVFYPRVLAPGSGSTDLEWVEACGRGVVYSTTVVRARPPAEPYNVALIDLEEGVRLMSRVEGLAAEAVAIGMRVRARIGRENDKAILLFEPAQ